MNRLAAFAIASSLFAGPAAAARYSADLANPATDRVITRDISWDCNGAQCQGATEYGRPVVLCQSLAKKVGKVARFAVNGRALGPDTLAQCNALAKDTGSGLAKAN